MSIVADLKILRQLIKPARGSTPAERLESFYAGQADGYDDFRKRLLPGREQMFQSIAANLLSPSLHAGRKSRADNSFRPNWLDLGGGTGANIEAIESFLPQLGSVHVVDLSRSLLKVADRRIEARGWTNVHTMCADVTTLQSPVKRVDVVTFSYSLTMIPDWLAALERAMELLAPGGWLGVIDFYVSHKHPPPGLKRHGWWTRTFWPTWFAFDNVFIGPDRLAALRRRLVEVELRENVARVPYVPLGKVPYFQLIGRKPPAAS